MFAGIGSKILSSLGTFEEDTPQEAGDKPSAAPSTTFKAPVSGAGAVVTHLNQEMIDNLQKAIMKRATQYTALLEASNKLSNVITDETTRVKAAFAMIAADGQRSLDSILQSIVIHQTDLDGELSRFKQATEQNIQAKVGSLRSQALSISRTREGTLATIASLEKQIAQQKESVLANEKEIVELSTQADSAEREINIVAQNFESAVNFVKQDLDHKKSQLASVLNS